MTAHIKLALKDWQVPNFATIIPLVDSERQEGFKALETIPLKNLEAETLDELCNNFRKEVFRKAEKKDPKI